jgi:hypothetical protein
MKTYLSSLLCAAMLFVANSIDWGKVNRFLGIPDHPTKEQLAAYNEMEDLDMPNIVVLPISADTINAISIKDRKILAIESAKTTKKSDLLEKYKHAPKDNKALVSSLKKNIGRQDSLRESILKEYDPVIEKNKKALSKLISLHKKQKDTLK